MTRAAWILAGFCLLWNQANASGGGGAAPDAKLQNKRGASKIQGAKQLAKRIRTRQKKFQHVRENDGLAALLFPGVVPEEYMDTDEIPVWMDWVNSEQAQIPFNYYSLPVCEGPTIKQTFSMRKNLGAKLQGHNARVGPYPAFHPKVNVPCTAVCQAQASQREIRKLKQLVLRRYRVHANFDSLPVITINRLDEDVDEDGEAAYFVKRGFPLGFALDKDGGVTDDSEGKAAPSNVKAQRRAAAKRAKPMDMDFYFYNHIRFIIRYEELGEDEGIRVVGFEAQPVSIDHKLQDPKTRTDDVSGSTPLKTCPSGASPENSRSSLLPIKAQPNVVSSKGSNQPAMNIIYSYEVQWLPSTLHWANRWDVYMERNPDDKLHLFGILNSLIVVFCLSCAVALVLIRTLRKDIAYYNEQMDLGLEGGEDEGGWKLLHGDVFRPPQANAQLLCIAVGTGMQLLAVVLLTIGISVSGLLPPMGKKGQLLTAAISFYILMGGVAGYWSARLFKNFDLQGWKANTFLTAVVFPSILVCMFLMLDVCLAFKGASSAVSIWTILLLFFLWICISSPLVFAGSYVGYRAKKMEVPTKTNQIARVIPHTAVAWYVRPPYSLLIGGALPFASCVLELFFIMEALWLHQIYYIMGFLFVVVFVVCIICAEVSISMCYLQLINEDHQWHWRAFLNSAGAAIYMMIYSIWFSSNKLELIGILPTLVYFTYMTMLAAAFGIMCGAVGFLSSLYFTKIIYGAVKVD